MVGGVYLNLFIAQPHWVSIETKLEILEQKTQITITCKIFNTLGIKKTERISTGPHGQIRCVTAFSFSGCKSIMIRISNFFKIC